jgi:LacI family transcriptional regulator
MEKNKDNRAIGIKEIAKKANVAIATVDRVIHNRPGVSQKTKDRINAIIKKLDYQPNILARRLATGEILEIAVLMPEAGGMTNYWASQLQGIETAENEIRQYGINIHKFFYDPSNKSSFQNRCKELLQKKPDTVLLIPAFGEETGNFINSCREKKIPVAFMNAEYEGADNLFYIGLPLYESGYQAAQLMNAAGKKGKILIVNIVSETDNPQHLAKKEEGFRAWFEENAIKTPIVKIDIHSIDQQLINKKLKATLQAHSDVQAIFVTGCWVFLVAGFLEIYPGKKIMLVGYDFLDRNVEYLKKDLVDFLICQKLHEQGYRGIMMLYQHLVFNTQPEKVYSMQIDIVMRENYIYYNN